jgi:hypothetical protein
MRKLSLLTIAIVASFLTIATTASAAERYADQSGNGPVTECFSSDPCSLEDALNGTYYGPGSTIHVLPGTYTLATGLTIGQAITVDGGTAADTIFHVTGSVTNALFLAANATFSDITIDADDADYGVGAGYGVTPVVSRAIVKNAGGSACTGYSITITDSICWATDANSNGFWSGTAGEFPQLTLRNSTVIGGSNADGMYLGMSSSLYTVNVTNTIFQGGTGSLSLYAGGTQAAPGVLDFTISHSSFISGEVATAGFGQLHASSLSDASNQHSAPLLAADFTQLAGSPTIDAGTAALPVSASDLAGLVRNQGSAPDIGAYEFPVAPVIPPADGGSGGGKTTPPDTTKPTITVSQKPKSKTTSKKLKVVFKVSETATFQCKLDKGKFKTCKSPYKKTVRVGKHKLQIKATDTAGNVSRVTSIKWTVKKP